MPLINRWLGKQHNQYCNNTHDTWWTWTFSQEMRTSQGKLDNETNGTSPARPTATTRPVKETVPNFEQCRQEMRERCGVNGISWTVMDQWRWKVWESKPLGWGPQISVISVLLWTNFSIFWLFLVIHQHNSINPVFGYIHRDFNISEIYKHTPLKILWTCPGWPLKLPSMAVSWHDCTALSTSFQVSNAEVNMNLQIWGLILVPWRNDSSTVSMPIYAFLSKLISMKAGMLVFFYHSWYSTETVETPKHRISGGCVHNICIHRYVHYIYIYLYKRIYIYIVNYYYIFPQHTCIYI